MAYRRPTWAPRIPRREIARLYATDARGIVDEDLIDGVGCGLLARCESVLAVHRAYAENRVVCPSCAEPIVSDHRRDRSIDCPRCGWSLPWSEFRQSTRRKCLDIGGSQPFLEQYVRDYPRARTPREKIVLIDQLIHRFHWELERRPGRPAANNLIGGKRQEVIALLNRLTYGEDSTPELKRNFATWRDNLERSGEG